MKGSLLKQLEQEVERIERRRAGFTLVEMLVSVGVVLIMMTLFATIFSLATTAMSTQKGNAENDQRVRLVETLLRNDLNTIETDPITKANTRQVRTFKVLVPYSAGELTAPADPWNTGNPISDNDRAGYFYISENNPNDDTDDKIQFTVRMGSSSSERFYGRAAGLFPDAAGHYGPADSAGNYPPAPPSPPSLAPAGNYWPNQPEFDDLLFYPNQAGAAAHAEVSYFLRNGTLYRRVMLLRDPNLPSGVTAVGDHTPEDNNGVALVMNAYTAAGSPSMWRDFDYSISYDMVTGLPAFHGDNDLGKLGVASSLFNPQNRFGFDGTGTLNAGFGKPREFDSSSVYFGGFTHADTSDANFGYPAQVTAANPNPMATATNLAFVNGQIKVTGSGPQYTLAGTRISEDIILTNVIGFDIKVWDGAAGLGPDGQPGIGFDAAGNAYDDDGINGANDAGERGAWGSDDGAWVDIGHAGTFGWYRAAAGQNAYFGTNPYTSAGRYDTWGPAVIQQTLATNDPPPFRPVYAGPDGKPGVALKDDDFDGTIDNASELGIAGSDDFAPLTAIKITIRFYDKTSNQVRDISGIFNLTPK